jgi:hypothetical protein
MDRFPGFVSYKRFRPRISAVLFLTAAFLLFGVYAHAAQVTMTITGTISQGTDFTGTFFAPRTDLTGKSFTLGFEMDDTQGVPIYGTWPADCDNGLQNSGLKTPVPHAVLTINGKSYTFGAYPTTSISSYVYSFNATSPPTSLYARIYQSRFDSGDVSLWGSESAAVGIDFNFYDCRSWESQFSYTLPGSGPYDGTNGGQASVEYSDLNTGATIVDFVAYFTVATVNVSGPQLPAISGKNNGGGKCQTCPCPAVERNLSLVGDPINAGTGNLFETQTDFTAAPQATCLIPM